MYIDIIYIDRLPVELIEYFNENVIPFRLFTFKTYEPNSLNPLLILLPNSFTTDYEVFILNLLKRNLKICFVSVNAVKWLRFLNSNNISDSTYNYKDLKNICAFIKKNVVPIEFDKSSLTMSYCEQTVDLSHKEFYLLYFLFKRYGRVVTRSCLMNNVWSYSNLAISKTLDSTISNVRKKFTDAFLPNLLHTVYGQGYKFYLDDN